MTLGTFLGTFLFCLVALRSIRDDSAYHLPALTAFVLTVISLSLFPYFVHHLVRSLQAENIVESVATLLLDEIENFFPEAPSSDSGEDEAERERKAWDELEGEISVLSEKAGYLQFIDTRQLLELASVHDCRIRVIIRPGQLVLESGCLFACETSGEMSEKGKKQFLDCFIVGRQRTPEQDIEFEIRNSSTRRSRRSCALPGNQRSIYRDELHRSPDRYSRPDCATKFARKRFLRGRQCSPASTPANQFS